MRFKYAYYSVKLFNIHVQFFFYIIHISMTLLKPLTRAVSLKKKNQAQRHEQKRTAFKDGRENFGVMAPIIQPMLTIATKAPEERHRQILPQKSLKMNWPFQCIGPKALLPNHTTLFHCFIHQVRDTRLQELIQ